MDDKILEILIDLKESITRLEGNISNLKEGQTRIENRLDGIESDIKDIKLDTSSIKIKETREDAESSELAIAQNSLDIAKIKMRMKMAQ